RRILLRAFPAQALHRSRNQRSDRPPAAPEPGGQVRPPGTRFGARPDRGLLARRLRRLRTASRLAAGPFRGGPRGDPCDAPAGGGFLAGVALGGVSRRPFGSCFPAPRAAGSGRASPTWLFPPRT